MTRLRTSLCTYNLWNTQRWPQREPALRTFLARFAPDIFAVQELREPVRACIDAGLPDHRRVVDAFAGWSCESNIWWNERLLQYVGHGAAEFGSHEATRRLFWVRLAAPAGAPTVLIATVHLTHTSHADEAATGQSPRIAQTRAIIEALEGLAHAEEAVFLLGDFNDPYHPSRMLHDAGYTSCFADLGLQPPPTFPAMPTAAKPPGEHLFNVCFDWIVARGPARPLAAHSPHLFHGDVSPSDHWPIVAVYEWGA